MRETKLKTSISQKTAGKDYNMGYLSRSYYMMSMKELERHRLEVQALIDNNDGRLSYGSSADLDFNLDKLDAIERAIKEKSCKKRK